MVNTDNVIYETICYRDGQIIEEKKFSELIDHDIDKDVKETKTFSKEYMRSVCYTDLSEGRALNVNGHIYQYKTRCRASTSKDIFNAFKEEYDYDELFNALDNIDETTMQKIVEHMPSISKDEKTGNYLMII